MPRTKTLLHNSVDKDTGKRKREKDKENDKECNVVWRYLFPFEKCGYSSHSQTSLRGSMPLQRQYELLFAAVRTEANTPHLSANEKMTLPAKEQKSHSIHRLV